MPTKKKRVGFIPREEVMKIIDKLSKENNLSNSKITSILVEEALSIRGIFNKNNGKKTKSYFEVIDDPDVISDNSKINHNFTTNSEIENHKNTGKNLLEQTNHYDFDFHTYKKFLSFLKFQEMMDKYNT